MAVKLAKAEVAALMGRSTRWVEQHAGRLGANNGTKREYDLAALPAEAQSAWARGEKVVRIGPASEGAGGQMALDLVAPVGPNLSEEDRAEAERRFAVIEKVSGGRCALGSNAVPGIAPRTVRRWVKLFREGGLPALVRRGRSDKGRPKAFNKAALDFILAAALPKKGSYGELSVREIHRAYEEERRWRASHADRRMGDFERRKYARYLDEDEHLKPEAQLPEASYETFRSWFHKIPEVVRVLAREGEEAFHNTQEILSFRAIAEIQPLDYVVMDHRRLDLFCMVGSRGGWRLVRPWLTAAIDMRTRKWLAWVIVETPSSDSIASVLKRSFLDWGLPGAVYWDNGKDFRCEWLEGARSNEGDAYQVAELGTGMRGVMDTLGVRVHHAIVKRARSKIIEPNFLNTALYDKSLPWWCGNRPDARPERFEELVRQHEKWVAGEAAEPAFPTIEKVAGLYEEFLESLNEREHSGEGMRKVTPTGRGWMCPNECWEGLIKKVARRWAPEEVIQFCFHKRRAITVRNGEVRATFGGRQFHYRIAAEPLKLMALNGRECEFAYDPHDLGTGAVYLDGAFVGLVENVELRRMGEPDFVQDERDRRTARREVKKFIGAVHQAVHVPGPEERADRRMAVRTARVDPERAVEAAPVPVAIAAAASAAEEGKSFRFADAEPIGVVAAEKQELVDDEFNFFQQ